MTYYVMFAFKMKWVWTDAIFPYIILTDPQGNNHADPDHRDPGTGCLKVVIPFLDQISGWQNPLPERSVLDLVVNFELNPVASIEIDRVNFEKDPIVAIFILLINSLNSSLVSYYRKEMKIKRIKEKNRTKSLLVYMIRSILCLSFYFFFFFNLVFFTLK